MYISEVVVHSGVELTALYQKLFVIFWLHIHIHERTNFLYVYIYMPYIVQVFLLKWPVSVHVVILLKECSIDVVTVYYTKHRG